MTVHTAVTHKRPVSRNMSPSFSKDSFERAKTQTKHRRKHSKTYQSEGNAITNLTFSASSANRPFKIKSQLRCEPLNEWKLSWQDILNLSGYSRTNSNQILIAYLWNSEKLRRCSLEAWKYIPVASWNATSSKFCSFVKGRGGIANTNLFSCENTSKTERANHLPVTMGTIEVSNERAARDLF